MREYRDKKKDSMLALSTRKQLQELEQGQEKKREYWRMAKSLPTFFFFFTVCVV
jgi:hypothetical protein